PRRDPLPDVGCPLTVGSAGGHLFVQQTPISQHFAGSITLSDITAVRSFVSGHSGELDGPWVPVSDDVQDGIDVDAAIGLVVGAYAYTSDACLTFFQFGTHQAGSSESDQELACSAATATAAGFAAFLATYVASNGPSILKSLEVIAAHVKGTSNATTNGITTDG